VNPLDRVVVMLHVELQFGHRVRAPLVFPRVSNGGPPELDRGIIAAGPTGAVIRLPGWFGLGLIAGITINVGARSRLEDDGWVWYSKLEVYPVLSGKQIPPGAA